MGLQTNAKLGDWCAAGILLLTAAAPSSATVWYVKTEASGTNNGGSWENAFSELQSALAVAAPSDQIWVASGVYVASRQTEPMDPRTAAFALVNGVALYGGFVGLERSLGERPVDPDPFSADPAVDSILSGDLYGNDVGGVEDPSRSENSYHVVTATNTDASTILDRFVIVGGRAEGAHYQGGGLYSDNGSPIVTHCLFQGNSATNAGGGMCSGNGGSPTVMNCTFIENLSYNDGGGMCGDQAHLRVINCRFHENQAVYGGGMAIYYGAGSIVNCVFTGNRAVGQSGGGFESVSCPGTTVTNCTFSGNWADNSGGGINHIAGEGPTLTNCVLWGNATGTGRGSQISVGGTGGRLVISYCDVAGGEADIQHVGATLIWGAGNLDGDPRFVDADGADDVMGTPDDDVGLLSPVSPCIDAGNNEVDIDGAAPGIQPLIGVEVNLNTRRCDDPAVMDTGFPLDGQPLVDMGAHEFGCAGISSRLFVDAGAAGAKTGVSWAGAFTDLKLALDTALVAHGRVKDVWVALGSYRPSSPGGDRTAAFNLVRGTPIYGGFAGTEEYLAERDPAANMTTLSGDLNNDDGLGSAAASENSYRVVAGYGMNAETVLDGFVIRGGNADGDAPFDRGAGLFLSGGRPQLRNCLVVGNTAASEGGGVHSSSADLRLGEFTVDLNMAPVGNGGLLYGNRLYLEGPFSLVGGDEGSPLSLELRASHIDGPGGIALGSYSTLRIAGGSFLFPVVIRSNVTGSGGTIEIVPGQQLSLEGKACVDLRSPGTGIPCGEGGEPGGRILIDGMLLARQESQIRNANITIRQANVQEDSQVQYNDIFMVDAISSGGQFFVEDSATVANNLITSMGDRYLDLDPDPAAPAHPDIDHNTLHVIIQTNPALAQGTLLELRARDDDCGGTVNPNCVSGAYQTTIGDRFEHDSAQNWVLDTLEIKPGAKLNLSNRPGFDFHQGSAHPETVYVRNLILHQGAILNTALQTLYYESLIMEADSQIVDQPLLGFSLGIIAMNDQTPPPFNEFDIRVRRRLRDTSDIQPQPPTSPLEGDILLLPNVRDAVTRDGVMEMTTQAPSMQSASSVAAKGSFARAGEEDIVVAFEYQFVSDGDAHDAEIVVKLSDGQDVGVDNYEVARVRPPAAGLPGSVGSSEYAAFYMIVPYEDWSVHLGTFNRGTYFELELRGKGAVVRIDNWDPQVICRYECASFDGVPGVTGSDFLILVAEYGRSLLVNDSKSCLDAKLNSDGYVDLSDLLSWDSYVSGGLNSCGTGATAPSPPVGPRPEAGRAASQAVEQNTLLVTGKPNGNGQQQDVLYTVTAGGSCSVSGMTPAGGTSYPRANGRLIRDGRGRAYQLHGVLGLVRLDDGVAVVGPRSDLSSGGDPVAVGVTPTGGGGFAGLPMTDAVFMPGSDTALFVIPVLVCVNSPAHTYRAAARLTLDPDNPGQYNLDRLYGMDPWQDPNANTTTPPEASPYNVQKLREIEIDPAGNRLYVTASQGLNNNDWLLIFDVRTGAEARIGLTGVNAQLKSPVAMLASAREDKLYLASSVSKGSGRVFRLGVSEASVEYEGELPLPDIRQITAMTEDPVSGTVYVVGFQSPDIPDDLSRTNPLYAHYFSDNSPIFSVPRVLVMRPAEDWPSSGLETLDLDSTDLALPLSAVYSPAPKADFDADGDVDGADYSRFASCVTGPAIRYADHPTPGCALSADGQGLLPADLDRDGDVDQRDFGVFQRCYGGPGVAVTADCTE